MTAWPDRFNSDDYYGHELETCPECGKSLKQCKCRLADEYDKED